VDLYYTVLPGAPARVHADPVDTALYVGGSVTFRPYITDAYTNPLKVVPTYQYQSLSPALSISAPGKATGAAFGRGSVAVSALGSPTPCGPAWCRQGAWLPKPSPS